MGILDSILGALGLKSQPAAPAPAPVPAPVAAAPAARPAAAAPAKKADVKKIDKVLIGESLVGDGNEVAHIDLIIGPRGSAAEAAFNNSLTNNKHGFTALLAVVAPNLMAKPNCVMFNKVTIKGAKQAVQMFGPAQRGVAMAVADSVEDGTIPVDQADDLFISVGVFIHWDAADDKKIQDYNYRATRESIQRAVAGEPTAKDVVAQKGKATHPFAAH
ncbi:MAG: formaldehyde-activating enzyme [Betaproteobacteria bacterium]|nr:formaldehyde-activating enzyme [Betaproteobacteria bacterium]